MLGRVSSDIIVDPACFKTYHRGSILTGSALLSSFIVISGYKMGAEWKTRSKVRSADHAQRDHSRKKAPKLLLVTVTDSSCGDASESNENAHARTARPPVSPSGLLPTRRDGFILPRRTGSSLTFSANVRHQISTPRQPPSRSL
jgi:hypothetical protein